MELFNAFKPRNFWPRRHGDGMAGVRDTGGSNPRDVFHRALDLQGEARKAYLDSACAQTPGLRGRVEALLRAHEGAGDFLLDPTAGGAAETIVGVKPGDRIGPYRLLEEIGSGGFGIVFRAEQREPVRRLVAIKVLKPGMDTRQVIARFEAERQAVALMDHPHIARVLDAGATPEGRPYFAMEYVEGEPITDFCDRHGLSVTDRIRLLLDVCEAVRHAHQKGVIHRDLKPSNILVADNDGKPLPKIIDFGIAKATGPSLTDETVITAISEMVGTPAYLSPEQVASAERGVDTRADIYSLGVILYELLTGSTPLDALKQPGRSLLELRQLILEAEPPRPSVRVAADGGNAGKCRTTHGCEPAVLRAQIHGDLDWIVTKAMEKDRTRRYATVDDFARDLERHLADEPVEARPPSTAYRVGKFVRRHRAGVAAALVALLSLAVGLAVALSALVEARQKEAQAVKQGNRARDITGLLKGVLESVDPTAKGEGYTVRALLDDYSRELPLGLAADAESESEVRLTMGRAYLALGEYQRAEPQLRRVLELASQHHGDRSVETARARREIGSLRLAQAQFTEADSELSAALTAFRASRGESDPEALETMAELAEARLSLNKPAEAAEQARRILTLMPAQPAAKLLPSQLSARSALAVAQFRSGEKAPALAEAEKVAAEALKKLGPRHAITRLTANRLAALTAEQKQDPARQKTFEEQLRALVMQMGIAHPDTLRQAIAQLQALIRGGQRDEARRRTREVIRIVQQAGGLSIGDSRAPLPKLVHYAATTGRISDFQIFIGDGIGLGRALFEPGEPELTWLTEVAALLYFYQNDLPKSEALFRDALAAAFAEGQTGRTAAAEAACFLQDVLARRHRVKEAEALLAGEPPLNVSGATWGALLHHAGLLRIEQLRWHEGIDLLYRGLDLRRKVLGTHADTLESLETLRSPAFAPRRFECRTIATEAVEMCAALHGPDDPRTLAARLAGIVVRRSFGDAQTADDLRELDTLARQKLPSGHALLSKIAVELEVSLKSPVKWEEQATVYEQKLKAAPVDSRDAFAARESMLVNRGCANGMTSVEDDLLSISRDSVAFFPEGDPWHARHASSMSFLYNRAGMEDQCRTWTDKALFLWSTANAEPEEVEKRLYEIADFWITRGQTDRFWQVWDEHDNRHAAEKWDAGKTHVLKPRRQWWSYWTDAASLNDRWMKADFDDSGWMTAKGWLSRQRNISGNRIMAWPPGAPATGTVCMRATFDVDEPARWQKLRFRLSIDDASAVWINDHAVIRDGVKDGLPLTQTIGLPKRKGTATFRPRVFDVDASSLRAGVNVIAVACQPVPGGEGDLFFELQIEALSR